ncbi:MAG: hypothetical protein ACO390_17040 [bacterium]
MRFFFGVALAVCGVLNAGETVPYVSGEVEFAPTSNNGGSPFYWDLGGGQGLLVAGGDYLNVSQDGWRIEAYDPTGAADFGSIGIHWLTSGFRVSSSSGATGAAYALYKAPVVCRRTYVSVDYEYDGTPVLCFVNGKPLRLPAQDRTGDCGGEIFGGYSGTFRYRVSATGPVEVIIWPLAPGADVVISNVTFE